MLETNGGPLTFIRFGLQRKKDLLRDVRNAYDGIVLPANILLYQYKSTPLVIYMCKRPFFTDPMTYLFGQPYEDFKQRIKKGPRFKPSFDKLMRGHGLNPSEYLPYEYTILLNHLNASEARIANFVDASLSFQNEMVWETVSNAKELMTEEQILSLNESEFRPHLLIPPYFLFTPAKTGERSLTTNLNKRILDYCSLQRTKYPNIYPMVFVQKDHLVRRDFMDQVIAILKENEFPGYCVWIEDFDERYATNDQIMALISLIKALAENGKQIVMLYGGFFSMLLSYFGLNCVCHGLAYGEARTISASAQQSSGPAPIRYYIYELHSFLTLDNALVVLREKPELICSCPVCQRVMHGDPEQVTRFAEEESLAEMHFLWNRHQERQMITNASVEEIIQHLDWTLTLNDDIREITRKYKIPNGYVEKPIIDPTYIRLWKNALTNAADVHA